MDVAVMVCRRSGMSVAVLTVLPNSGHLLRRFLPLPTAASQNYNLRYDKQLTLHSGHLTDSNVLLACYTQTYTSQTVYFQLNNE